MLQTKNHFLLCNYVQYTTKLRVCGRNVYDLIIYRRWHKILWNKLQLFSEIRLLLTDIKVWHFPESWTIHPMDQTLLFCFTLWLTWTNLMSPCILCKQIYVYKFTRGILCAREALKWNPIILTCHEYYICDAIHITVKWKKNTPGMGNEHANQMLKNTIKKKKKKETDI